jgi:hypothetical protein
VLDVRLCERCESLPGETPLMVSVSSCLSKSPVFDDDVEGPPDPAQVSGET